MRSSRTPSSNATAAHHAQALRNPDIGRALLARRLQSGVHAYQSVAACHDEDSAVIAHRNLQRENLHFFEEAEGYQCLMKEHGLTQEELARRLGKNQSTVANKMRILKLTAGVKEIITTYKLTERHSRALLRLHNE